MQRLKRDSGSGKKIAEEEPVEVAGPLAASNQRSGLESSQRVSGVQIATSSRILAGGGARATRTCRVAPGWTAWSGCPYVGLGSCWTFSGGACCPGGQKLTEKDSILLADFVNTTGDPVFDGTLKQALAVQLEQSPYLNIVPDQTIRKALQFMGRSADERVTWRAKFASGSTSRPC